MARKKPTNPFYVVLLPVGVVFVLTACAFVVMMMQVGQHPAGEADLIRLMERHGIIIMAIELALLGVLTVAAIATDDFWVRRFEAAQSRQPSMEDVP